MLAPPATAAGVPPGFISETLENGLRVSILPDPANPVVATQLWYQVGSANEQPDNRGFAHLFEHLMFGETTTVSTSEYEQYHHLHGVYNLLVPIFFCVMGMMVDFKAMAPVLVFGSVYSLLTIISKVIGCGVLARPGIDAPNPSSRLRRQAAACRSA